VDPAIDAERRALRIRYLGLIREMKLLQTERRRIAKTTTAANLKSSSFNFSFAAADSMDSISDDEEDT
jgi:hypothetical protein